LNGETKPLKDAGHEIRTNQSLSHHLWSQKQSLQHEALQIKSRATFSTDARSR
jgi:hypothetical protein